jgi:hypothetical protein
MFFEEPDYGAIHDFISIKERQNDPRTDIHCTSAQLYLPLMDGEIRVLELHPAAFDAPFQAKLHVVSIDFTYFGGLREARRGRNRPTNHGASLITKTPVWYTALSYTWGVPAFNQIINFDVGSVKITSSLACAIQHLRSSEHGIYLWIDQICINQSDLREKETQIPLMELIYSHATNTVIWLGDHEDSDPPLAFKTMQEVHSRIQLNEQAISPEDFEHLFLPPVMDRSWWVIQQFFRRPWFTRTWTIQEACLSGELFVQCGKAVRNWNDIASWCYTLEDSGILKWLMANDALDRKYSKRSIADMRSTSGIATISLLNQIRMSQSPLVDKKEPLLHTLASTRYAAATEPKDKVYGLLGIAECSVLPNYSSEVTPGDVYHEACLSELSIRVYAQLSCVDHDIPCQPTWVPDWSVPRVTGVLGFSTMTQALYSAGGSFVPGKKYEIAMALSEDKKNITLCGKIFDEVTTISAVSVNPVLCIDAPSVHNNKWAIYADLANNSSPDHTYPGPDTSVYNAFFQTLVAGRDHSGTSPPSSEHNEVFSLILDSTMGRMPSIPGQTYSPRRKKGYFTLENLRSRRPAKARETLQVALQAALHMRRFAVTRKGYFALVPRGTRQGDEIVVFKKACVPFVIRKTKLDGNASLVYQLLGESYVHGIMRGEALEMDHLPFGDVTLV